MWTTARAVWDAGRIPVLFGALMFVMGALLAAPGDTADAPTTPTTTVAQVTPAEVARLADALEALATTTTAPTTTTTTVATTTTTAPTDSVLRWPSATVPPPYTVTVP